MTPINGLIFVMFLPLAAATAAALGQPFKRLPSRLIDPALKGRVLMGERPLKGREPVGVKLSRPYSFPLPLPKVLGLYFYIQQVQCDQGHTNFPKVPGDRQRAGKAAGLVTRTENDRRYTGRSISRGCGGYPLGYTTWGYP